MARDRKGRQKGGAVGERWRQPNIQTTRNNIFNIRQELARTNSSPSTFPRTFAWFLIWYESSSIEAGHRCSFTHPLSRFFPPSNFSFRNGRVYEWGMRRGWKFFAGRSRTTRSILSHFDTDHGRGQSFPNEDRGQVDATIRRILDSQWGVYESFYARWNPLFPTPFLSELAGLRCLAISKFNLNPHNDHMFVIINRESWFRKFASCREFKAGICCEKPVVRRIKTFRSKSLERSISTGQVRATAYCCLLQLVSRS